MGKFTCTGGAEPLGGLENLEGAGTPLETIVSFISLHAEKYFLGNAYMQQ